MEKPPKGSIAALYLAYENQREIERLKAQNADLIDLNDIRDGTDLLEFIERFKTDGDSLRETANRLGIAEQLGPKDWMGLATLMNELIPDRLNRKRDDPDPKRNDPFKYLKRSPGAKIKMPPQLLQAIITSVSEVKNQQGIKDWKEATFQWLKVGFPGRASHTIKPLADNLEKNHLSPYRNSLKS